ncbi:recombinase zinc beta ribbon domain-containing protein [Brevibacillus brevis]|uniref:recombinase zinc beta ribbon domain-containing protein n=1 Tax=Brevibacillus brevis TaxID=1393 RepID=UPI003F573104
MWGFIPGSKRALKGFYVCTGKQAFKGPMQGKCTSKSLPQDWIEDLVWRDCLALLISQGKPFRRLLQLGK